jgi:hypothetical protein
VNTLPVGLFGVLMMIARVLLVNAAASSPGSKVQSGSWSVTYRGVAESQGRQWHALAAVQ